MMRQLLGLCLIKASPTTSAVGQSRLSTKRNPQNHHPATSLLSSPRLLSLSLTLGLSLISCNISVPSDLMAATNPSAAFEKEQIFGMAEKEMEYRVDMFNKLTQTCFSKCIEGRHKESELNMGENSCIDRCVSKYWQVTNLVGQLLGSNQPPM
ncbi:hypothetical protein RHSIM_Rhsim04G0164100 [Rhododendron simsii]|uniref:Tim10-like domain-containing protein n=1 Tax=Rhododendron simsii TaxID=118357 RepID=A0A834LRM4_RHOSS|nr:hypothetical protein RHSIM_Rhsim04G0164100 [Rhododendron simsii]